MSPEDTQLRLLDVFKRLAIRCLELDLPGYAENFCNLLVAVRSGRWQQLSESEREMWLGKVADLLHAKALGDSIPDVREPAYVEAVALIDALRKATRRAT